MTGWEWLWWAGFCLSGALCLAGSRSAERRARLHDAAKKPWKPTTSTHRYHGNEAERLRDLGRYWLFSVGLLWVAAIAVVLT